MDLYLLGYLLKSTNARLHWTVVADLLAQLDDTQYCIIGSWAHTVCLYDQASVQLGFVAAQIVHIMLSV